MRTSSWYNMEHRRMTLCLRYPEYHRFYDNMHANTKRELRETTPFLC